MAVPPRIPITQIQIQRMKSIPFISNLKSNPFLNFLVIVKDKVDSKHTKAQIKDKLRNRKEILAVSAVKTAKNGRSGGTRTRGLQYPKLARYQLRYTSIWWKIYLVLELWAGGGCSARPCGLDSTVARFAVNLVYYNTFLGACQVLWISVLKKRGTKSSVAFCSLIFLRLIINN